MSNLIEPVAGAIDRYLWDIAQDSIRALLQVVSDAQTVLNADYKFVIKQDLFRPSIELITENNHLVNILVATVTSDSQETNFSKNHIVTYHLDLYVQGFNEDDPDNAGSLIPADEAAVARLKYLCAMVEYSLTKLANFYLDNSVLTNKIIPEKINLTFNPVPDPENSATPYAPARFEFVCKFPYDAQDLTDLPELTRAKLDLTEWASQVLYS